MLARHRGCLSFSASAFLLTPLLLLPLRLSRSRCFSLPACLVSCTPVFCFGSFFGLSPTACLLSALRAHPSQLCLRWLAAWMGGRMPSLRL